MSHTVIPIVAGTAVGLTLGAVWCWFRDWAEDRA